MLNNVFDSLSGNINSQIIIKETLVYLFVSIKCILTYFFSFQWLRNVSYFPILVPQLHSSVLNETYFLHNPVSTIFTFLETPTYGNNKLVLGFLNSFFFLFTYILCSYYLCKKIINSRTACRNSFRFRNNFRTMVVCNLYFVWLKMFYYSLVLFRTFKFYNWNLPSFKYYS